ncbi:DUF2807 domain-containing protein [Lutibacter sp.]|uniref:GIN domain-containing protein n=1 Tax=Lutibacter sp. TaxID=1925666 RepID=UPI001A1FD040|nr:DUF2807 domain-containing protein [Lutibacter sp.]MBI9040499.1 DUF2807 domain-containing protein [Lutibacter sp.]
MKKIVLMLILVICITNVFAQKKAKLKGNKIVTDVFNTLEGFNAVDIGDNLKVTISQAGNNGYHLMADENLVSDINFQVIDSVLKIYTTSNIVSKKKLEIDLTVKNISNLTLRDDAKLTCISKIYAKSLTFAAFDNASFKLDLKADNSYFRLAKSVSGEISLNGQKAVMMFDENSFMKGNVVLEELELKMTDRSDLDLSGEVNNLQFNGTGSGTLKGKDLKTTNSNVNIAESALVHIYTSKLLKIYAKDKSKIYVYGKPEIKVEGLNDKSEIIKR